MHFVQARSILSAQNGMNLYRGCMHGCIYCDSRSCVYGMTHAFEDIEVKANAPELLEQALRRKREKCMIGTGSMCDPYMPCEAELGLTRRCLEIIADHGFGAAVLTKSDLVLRDLDLLQRINRQAKCVVQMTLTTADEALCRILEPGVCSTARRIEVLCALRDAGIPTVVWLSPFLPFINDTEDNLRALLDACILARVHGVVCFGIGMTLREGNREYFYQALDRHFPGLKQRYCETYGSVYEIVSPNHDALIPLLHAACEEHGILHTPEDVFRYLQTFSSPESYEQLRLF